jgi:hypothetical protein
MLLPIIEFSFSTIFYTLHGTGKLIHWLIYPKKQSEIFLLEQKLNKKFDIILQKLEESEQKNLIIQPEN